MCGFKFLLLKLLNGFNLKKKTFIKQKNLQNNLADIKTLSYSLDGSHEPIPITNKKALAQ